jgi:hydrogenase expression/formation protein HypC
MKIVEIRNDGTGIVDLDGSRHEANLSLIAAPKVGDYVIVHAGFAIEKLDEQEANEQLALFAELAQSQEPEDSSQESDR